MKDTELYRQILDIRLPFEVVEVGVEREAKEVRVRVECPPSEDLKCPECGRVCSQYDSVERSWRHLDTCQYRTILTAKIPRVKCPEHYYFLV